MTMTRDSDRIDYNGELVKCRDCGRGFTISPDEKRFFLDRNLTLPKRCPECRGRRRQETYHV